ncbi:hypothetical protein MVEN_00279600 [Mycena venus]|uniref:Uncharacterized protein n=1 Tax=Mycena venus TaxID=2733690 RepID=A0A8H6YYP4_9AGAR|nr:hypothetical protein MVEN_00279600 [Mycena venus]
MAAMPSQILHSKAYRAELRFYSLTNHLEQRSSCITCLPPLALPRTWIMQVAVHLLISTATSFLVALLVLTAASFHAPMTLVLGVTVIFNLIVFGIMEIIGLLGHGCSTEGSLENAPFVTDYDLKEAEEGMRLVAWEI